jgi:hypothetical protein
MSSSLAERAEARFWDGVAATEAFFMGTDAVHHAMAKLTQTLDELGVPYAVVGAMALNEYGYRRATVDVDVLLTQASLDRFKAAWLGRGYVERFPGSRGVRDTEHGVDIDFVITGHFPGDGKPKAIQFPDPAEVAARGARVALLPLPRLIELKLASGMSAPHRAKDLVDVQELVRHAALPLALAEELDPSVRAKYRELWGFAQVRDDE